MYFLAAEEGWILFSNSICLSLLIGELRPFMLRVINEQCLLISVILLLWCGPLLSFELVGSDVFLAGLPFCEIWSFSFAAFNILSFFCMFNVFITIWCGNFFSAPLYFVFCMHLAHWLAYLSLDLRKFLLRFC